jgi:hypothetical protein
LTEGEYDQYGAIPEMNAIAPCGLKRRALGLSEVGGQGCLAANKEMNALDIAPFGESVDNRR